MLALRLAAIVGGAIGAAAVTTAIGLTAFGLFKHRQSQERKEQRAHTPLELSAVANPLQRGPAAQ